MYKIRPKQNSLDPARESELFKRRSFLKTAAFASATTALLLSGCKEYIETIPAPDNMNLRDTPDIRLGSGDVGVLNYAYALEQLEAAFYMRVVDSANFSSTFNREEQQILRDIRNHEVVHRDFLKAALGANAIPTLNFTFGEMEMSNRDEVLGIAKTFEDLGVAAYNGAGHLLDSRTFIMLAGKIVSVEARHASVIREILDDNATSFAGDDIINQNGLERAIMPMEVIEAASPFIRESIDASQLK